MKIRIDDVIQNDTIFRHALIGAIFEVVELKDLGNGWSVAKLKHDRDWKIYSYSYSIAKDEVFIMRGIKYTIVDQ